MTTPIEEQGKIIEYTKLKSDIFDMLLACQETRGSISHFSTTKHLDEEKN